VPRCLEKLCEAEKVRHVRGAGVWARGGGTSHSRRARSSSSAFALADVAQANRHVQLPGGCNFQADVAQANRRVQLSGGWCTRKQACATFRRGLQKPESARPRWRW
jgi:hypothetical protein